MTNVEFCECSECQTVHLIEKDHIPLTPYKCPNCEGTAFRTLGKKFILHCPVCLEYWSKHVIKANTGEGICQCIKKGCNAFVKIRKEWGAEILTKEEANEQGLGEIEEPIAEIKDELIEINKPDLEETPEQTLEDPSESVISEQEKRIVPEDISIPPSFQEEPHLPPEPQAATLRITPVNTSIETRSIEENINSEISEMPQIKQEQIIIAEIETAEPNQAQEPPVEQPIIDDEPSFSSEKAGLMENLVENSDEPLEFGVEMDINPNEAHEALTPELCKTLFSKMLACPATDALSNLEEARDIFRQMLTKIYNQFDVLVEEPIHFIYYVGNLGGDFDQCQRIVKYFVTAINTFPSAKIIFMGNYMGQNQNDLQMLALLSLFYLQYPENIVMLRGCNDFQDNLDESGLWTRIKKISPKDAIDITERAKEIRDIRGNIYQSILNIYTHLPLLHIASMNQGQIAVLSSHSGIPLNTERPNSHFTFTDSMGEFMIRSIRSDELDDVSWSILRGIPEPALENYTEFGTVSEPPRFSQRAFVEFLLSNNCHYFVRSHDEIVEGIAFCFENNLCCTIHSAAKYDSLNNNIESQFAPKIIRLVPASPPAIINANSEGFLADLKTTFNIDQTTM